MRMAEPHTLTFLFTKRRRTDGQAVRRGRGSAGPFRSAARSRLEEAKWEAALAEGWAMPLDDAVAYALEDAARS